jgi:peroxiredoxin
MKLTVGMVAPPFATADIFGNPVTLTSYAGKRLLLTFFRNGACALCNLRVHHLIERFPAYQARGLCMAAVFESPRESVLRHVSKQHAPFPIIADPGAALYDLYGVETSQEKVLASLDHARNTGLIRAAEAIGYPLTPEEGSNFFRVPAEFLIGPDQRVELAFYAEVVGDHLAFADLDAALLQPA